MFRLIIIPITALMIKPATDDSHGELIRLRVHLPEALEDTITVRFELPGYYLIGDLISLLTAMLFLGLWILSCRSRSKNKEPLTA